MYKLISTFGERTTEQTSNNLEELEAAALLIPAWLPGAHVKIIDAAGTILYEA